MFIVTYLVSRPVSFTNVHTYFLPEIARYSPATPVVLVGTMDDLRHKNAVPAEEGDRVRGYAYVVWRT